MLFRSPMFLAALDLTVIPCVPAAIEEIIALAAQVQEEVLVLGVEVVVAGADDKSGLDPENNEHQVGLQHLLKTFSDRFHSRRFWVCRIGIASRVRKKIRYKRELSI